MAKSNTTWSKIDVATLSPSLKAKLATLHKAFEAVKTAKATFDGELVTAFVASQGKLPDGMELAVSHRFGLAVAIVPTEAAKPAKGALSLAA